MPYYAPTIASISAGGVDATGNRVIFSNSNGVSFGANGATITATVAPGAAAGIAAVSAGTQVQTSGTLTFGDSQGISFGLSGSSQITATADYVRSLSAGTTNATGNQVVFSDSNALSFGANGATITGSFRAVKSVSAGTTRATAQEVVFSDSNALSWGANGATITGSFHAIKSISAGTTRATAQEVVFSNTANGVVFGANAATVTASLNPICFYDPYPIQGTGTGALSLNTNTSGAGSFIPFVLPCPVAVLFLDVLHSVGYTTYGTSTAEQTGVQYYGLFTRGTGASSTTLSRIGSSSWSFAHTYDNSTLTFSYPTTTNITGYGYGSTTSAGVNVSSSFTGLKHVQIPIAQTLSAGRYWLGAFARQSSINQTGGIKLSLYGVVMSVTGAAPFGYFSSAYSSGTNHYDEFGGAWMPFFGSHTAIAGQTDLQDTLPISRISVNLSVRPYFRMYSWQT